MINISFNSAKEKYLDYAHFSLGLIIFVMALLAVFNPQKNMVLFPFIFLFSAVLHLLIFLIEFFLTKNKISKKQGFCRLMCLVFSIFLFAAFFISKKIIWS